MLTYIFMKSVAVRSSLSYRLIYHVKLINHLLTICCSQIKLSVISLLKCYYHLIRKCRKFSLSFKYQKHFTTNKQTHKKILLFKNKHHKDLLFYVTLCGKWYLIKNVTRSFNKKKTYF